MGASDPRLVREPGTRRSELRDAEPAVPRRSALVRIEGAQARPQALDLVEQIERADDGQAAGDADEIMVIGGGVLFADTITLADRLYLTVIQAEVEGDTWFPFFSTDDWQETFSEHHDPDDKNPWTYDFLIWEHVGN